MAYPPPRLACNGLSRHILGRKLPPVFHDPLHAAQLWIVRAYRVLPKAAEQIHPAVARFHSQRAGRHPLRGCCFEKRLFPAPKRSALKQICKSACGQAL
ncbi:hypothetical protein D3C73_1470930 [compost metagenome]